MHTTTKDRRNKIAEAAFAPISAMMFKDRTGYELGEHWDLPKIGNNKTVLGFTYPFFVENKKEAELRFDTTPTVRIRVFLPNKESIDYNGLYSLITIVKTEYQKVLYLLKLFANTKGRTTRQATLVFLVQQYRKRYYQVYEKNKQDLDKAMHWSRKTITSELWRFLKKQNIPPEYKNTAIAFLRGRFGWSIGDVSGD